MPHKHKNCTLVTIAAVLQTYLQKQKKNYCGTHETDAHEQLLWRRVTCDINNSKLRQGLGMMSQATEMHERVSAVSFHGHDTQVSAEVTSVAPANGQSVSAGE